MSLAEATKTESLEKRVEELEKALRDADHEMEEVVGRMNLAQMEVADLQFERDEAMRQTRKLQAEIVAEREKVKALMATSA
jgi:prefoldin subunit 5